jgi:ubiquinone/menaquinone biosynthesis C-methylase UbiE
MRSNWETRIEVLTCDALALPLKGGTFDAVVAQHVIEHLEDPVLALNEWGRVLRCGGLCVLVTPNRRFPLLSWFDDPTHRRLFDATELWRAMAEAGLKKIVLQRLVPWLGSERLVYVCARIQRALPILGKLANDPSLSLIAVGRTSIRDDA